MDLNLLMLIQCLLLNQIALKIHYAVVNIASEKFGSNISRTQAVLFKTQEERKAASVLAF